MQYVLFINLFCFVIRLFFYVCVHIQNKYENMYVRTSYICMYVFVHVCMYACKCLYEYMFYVFIKFRTCFQSYLCIDINMLCSCAKYTLYI